MGECIGDLRRVSFSGEDEEDSERICDGTEKVVSRETIIVLFADCIVSSILYLFEKDPMAQLDYRQLIDTVFKKKLETDELWGNEISLAQLWEMKKIFVEEKLYYDFLR